MASHFRDSSPLDCKVYVGDLGTNGTKHEIERAFSYYGPLRNVWVARNPPGFAFVEFEDPRDASDACRGLDKTKLCGVEIRAELSSGKSRWAKWGRPPPRRSFSEERCYECGKRGHFARDCYYARGGGGGGSGSGGGGGPPYGRSRGYSSRRRSRSRSRSRSPYRRNHSRSRSRSRSRSPSRD
ncbi:serine/arginine-rich splicing factor 3-like [Saccoglossus kowalevskii]|uniref:Serine/arginine-rich splicing factor 7-like isoform X1 n=1 Tax=Saccoglossus kowalevskii TaxID=10224 RepID=A0ABM0GQC9_SACKO|nr:PREDICTED: serine/arginine-rich splicing factor 7-like isoform X1 [Saccoglossus kowalevskii]